MGLTGLIRHMEMSRTRSIIVDRSLSAEYPGYVRTITIQHNNIVKIEFEVYGYDEGGITYFIQYKNIDILIKSLEKYLSKDLVDWENVDQTGYYPEKPNDQKKEGADEKIEADLISNSINLPLNGMRTWMPGGYWKDLCDKFST